MDSIDILHFIYTRIKPEYPKYPMNIGMGIDFENPMGIGMGMGMTFENGYGCGYSYTRPEPAPRPSLEMGDKDVWLRKLHVGSKRHNLRLLHSILTIFEFILSSLLIFQ